MSELIEFTALALAITIGLYYLKKYYEFKHFPPGPPSLPIVGCVPFLPFKEGARNLMASVNWIPKYGDLIGLRFETQKMVFVQTFDKAKEMAFNDKFAGRCKNSNFMNNVRGIDGKAIGIITNDGQLWKSLRGFAMITLNKFFGLGKKSVETIIKEETEIVLEELPLNEDVLIKFPFNISILNIVWRIVAGKRFETNDRRMFEMFETLNKALENAFVELFFPYIYNWIPGFTGWDHFLQHSKEVKELIFEAIHEHKKTRVVGRPRDFIDVYLEKSEEIDSPKDIFTENHLVGVCLDLFEAGGETVGSTLSWVLLYLSLQQKEQTKCQEEIDSVIGKSRSVSLADKQNLPFCEAFLWEVQRMSCVAAAGLEHRATESIPFHGFIIPKDTMVYYNIYNFHMDPDYWGDPKVFRPSRFLIEDSGKFKLEKRERFIPYGFGKRVCMGENLAKAELWLFLTAILQKFTIKLPNSHPVPNPEDDIAGLTRSPQPFHVHIESRDT